MAQTPGRLWPYAGPNDAPDVPYWQQRIAEKGDAETQALDDRTPFKIATGTGTLSIGAANTFVSSNVNFPAGFTLAPVVTVTFASNAARASMISAYSATTAGFTVKMQTCDGATYGASFTLAFNWTAIQRTPTSATG
jgi:hypothetical protein